MPDFRVIPSIDVVRHRPVAHALAAEFGDAAVLDALRESTAALRAQLADGAAAAPTADDAVGWIEADAAVRLRRAASPSLRPVINATGVIVHTNLGRAPLSPAALARLVEVGAGYTNLEYDLSAGHRGARDTHAEALLCRLTGAEAAVVVNNCAAATMLALSALARGREVIISRAELVEIGGGFRVPDIMAQSGARLREVGTTNRTRIGDYSLAIGDRTGALLRVHPSNFRISGFTERASLTELVALARRFSVPLIEDLGSGHCAPAPPGVAALDAEPTVRQSVAAGVDVVCFSGDKLLGGPQAGIIVGRSGVGVDAATTPADARASSGQAHLRGARSDAWRAPRRARAGHSARVADGQLAGGSHRGARRDRGRRVANRRALGRGDRRTVHDRRRQRAGQRAADASAGPHPSDAVCRRARVGAACPGSARHRPYRRRHCSPRPSHCRPRPTTTGWRQLVASV